MTLSEKLVFYCDANFVARDTRDYPQFISLALVAPGGAWYYAEIVDYDAAECDEFAKAEVVPRLRKIPGTRFLNREQVHSDVSKWLRDCCVPGSGIQEIEIRYANSESLTAIRFIQYAARGFAATVPVDRAQAIHADDFHAFQVHCGGCERVQHHALINAIGHAVCDLRRDEEIEFQERPIRHLELIMGSKNATSYRAWVRNHEKDRLALRSPVFGASAPSFA